MNLLQLVFKQMRQRALSTFLTLLSVTLGVALAVSILVLQRESSALFGQADYGFDLVIGAKGSALQMVLNSVYHMDQPVGTLPYSYVDTLPKRLPGASSWRIPFAVLADNYEGWRVFATEAALFRAAADGSPLQTDTGFAPRSTRPFVFAQGRAFHNLKFEAVLGADVARRTGLKLGDTFQAAHEAPQKGLDPHVHGEQWTVAGILEPTGTSFDRLIYIPLVSTYCIAEHESALLAQSRLRGVVVPPGPAPAPPAPAPATSPVAQPASQDHDEHAHSDHGQVDAHDHDDHSPAGPATTTSPAPEEHDRHIHADAPGADAPGDADDAHDPGHSDEHNHLYHLEPDGTIKLHLPREQWMISGAFVKATRPPQVMRMMYDINNGPDAQAANPPMVMTEFLERFVRPGGWVLMIVAVLVIIVAGVSILVSIYNSISARMREIAILRALGATRGRILAIICLEATLIGLIGAVLGLVLGHLIAALGSGVMERLAGQGIAWYKPTQGELWFLLGVVALSALAGLVPALKAYRTPVADNLVSI